MLPGQPTSRPIIQLAACTAIVATALATMAATPRPGPAKTPAMRYHWTTLAPSPLGKRSDPVINWTGKQLIELGGLRKGRPANTGAGYDPATNRWHLIKPVGANVGFTGAVTAWTGTQLFVTNGQPGRCPAPSTVCRPLAGLYDPATNEWTTTVWPRKLTGFAPTSAVWTGHLVVLAAVRVSPQVNHSQLAVATYTPATKRWQLITPAPIRRHPVQDAVMVPTPRGVILWTPWNRVKKIKNGSEGWSGTDIRILRSSGNWHRYTGSWPQDQTITDPTFTGKSVLVSPGGIWCGNCSPPLAVFDGYFVNPATLHRSIIKGGPLGQSEPGYVWTGRQIFAVNLDASITGPRLRIRPDDLAAYNPATKAWHLLPALPRRPDLAGIPVWADRELLALTASGRLWALRK